MGLSQGGGGRCGTAAAVLVLAGRRASAKQDCARLRAWLQSTWLALFLPCLRNGCYALRAAHTTHPVPTLTTCAPVPPLPMPHMQLDCTVSAAACCEVVKALLAHPGTNPNTRNHAGLTPLTVVSSQRYT